ncbi:putative short-chain dehydrogenase/reductase family protein [Penicillium brasilianum]|uniref:Putative short-chain dehydrogenase/reductase family protein n=1 Tax=Penicillium brasilianum TaxID=104259 RepID=A0A1S9RH39_PENBI|nr:putative short-chain dehydrogenase/reductase family protein [Penicillium brasilianum]
MPSSKELLPSTAPFFPNQFIKNQFCSKPQYPPKDTDLSGKVAIVTGSNTGLGFECARQLLSYKLSRLIIAVRTAAKGKDAAAKLRDQYPNATIDVWLLDMSSYESVRAFVTRTEKELSRLDIAILNAGITGSEFKIVPETSHEEALQVNYLSTMLLTILLLPILKVKSDPGQPGRLTIVTTMLSIIAKFANKNANPLLPSFDDRKNFDSVDNYSKTKLLGQLSLWKLADLVSSDDTIINMVEPGFTKGTELQRDAPFATKVALNLLKAVSARDVKLAASTYIDAAIVKGKDSHGSILTNWEIAPYAPFEYTSEGHEVMERLWKETIEELGPMGVGRILESLSKS